MFCVSLQYIPEKQPNCIYTIDELLATTVLKYVYVDLSLH